MANKREKMLAVMQASMKILRMVVLEYEVQELADYRYFICDSVQSMIY